MAGHESDFESSVHQLQDPSDGSLHGGGRQPDDQVREEADPGVWMLVLLLGTSLTYLVFDNQRDLLKFE